METLRGVLLGQAIKVVPFVIVFGLVFGSAPSFSQQAVPTAASTKQVMELTKGSWVQFRNYDGKQLLYFTHFVTWKCGIETVTFSLNDRSFWREFPLPDCNEDIPLQVDPTQDLVYLTYQLGTVKTVSVQLEYIDGTKSKIREFRPCNVDKDQTCVKLVE